MKPVVTYVGLLAACAVAAAGFYVWNRSAPIATAPRSTSSLETVPTSRDVGQEKSAASSPLQKDMSSAIRLHGRSDYKKMYSDSHNYWDLVHVLLPAAKAGDADAQYYLATALSRCNQDNRMFFQRRGETLTVAEGIEWAEQRHLSIDIAQLVYDRCHDFLTRDAADLGAANDWLERASAAGQPLAQADMALKLGSQEILRDAQRAGGAPNPDAPASVQSDQDMSSLLRQAVESRDPHVLFDIGSAQGFLSQGETQRTVNQFAWWLVACERGLDCSANSEWVKIACSGDPRCASFTDPSDFVRTLSGNNWDSISERAKDIDAKLDAGQWDDLGLGS
jgi:hypothetical protein